MVPSPSNPLLLRGGFVVYSDGHIQVADILIQRGLIKKIASNIRAPEGTRIISCKGMYIYPGFVDAHAHMLGLGKSLHELNLRGCRSYEELLERVEKQVKKTPPGEWILGRGWDQNLWDPPRMPHHEKLSAITPNHPIWLRRVDGHAVLVNQKALDLANITENTPDPSGGKILRDSQGKPTGVLIDNAQDLVRKILPEPTLEKRKAYLLEAQEKILSLGLTGVHDAGVDKETLNAYFALEREGKLKAFYNLMLSDDEALLREWFSQGPYLSPHLRVQTVKLYADGALGSRGALLLADYTDQPGWQGLWVTPPERIKAIMEKAYDAGFQVAVHCIGDGAVHGVTQIIQEVVKESNRRYRIEHFQVFDPKDLSILKEKGVVISMQPYHRDSDWDWADERLGERIAYAYAWQKVWQEGFVLALGSDFPVEEPDPFLGFGAACRGPQKLTPTQALQGYTYNPQVAAFQEARKGKIAPGYDGDLTVLRENILHHPEQHPTVAYVITQGEVVYEGK